MPGRSLPDEAPAAATSLGPHPFASAIPLLDGSEHMLPPILPAKRQQQGFAPEDTITPGSMPISTDWAAHAPTQPPATKVMRPMRALSRSTGSPGAAYGMPRTGPRNRDGSPQQAVHLFRGGTLAGGAGDAFNTGRPGVTSSYSVSGKPGEMLYPSDASGGFDAGVSFRGAEGPGISRPVGYGDVLGPIAPGGGVGSSNGGGGSGGGSVAVSSGFMGTTGSAGRGRRVNPCDDSFVVAAETGARAQCAVDNANGDGSFETYELGIAIVQSSKLYANQRRSNRQLPGGSDSTTAACYMIGGTPDSVLSPLLAKVSPCDPREERCKAVERVLKDKTRGAICALNGENPREARADNLAAVRICEVVADILVAYSSKRLFESRKQLFQQVERQEEKIKELTEQLDEYKRREEQWHKGETGSGRVGEVGLHVEERTGGVGEVEGRETGEEHKSG